jgi:hypothetical protein
MVRDQMKWMGDKRGQLRGKIWLKYIVYMHEDVILKPINKNEVIRHFVIAAQNGLRHFLSMIDRFEQAVWINDRGLATGRYLNDHVTGCKRK